VNRRIDFLPPFFDHPFLYITVVGVAFITCIAVSMLLVRWFAREEDKVD